MTAPESRLSQQIAFIVEIEKLKRILRQTYHLDGSRRENDAEHAWHLGMMALILQEYADPAVDIGRVIKMVLVHDLVEIDAGDTFVYDQAGLATQGQREREAADRIFPLLPADQAAELRALWDEFEQRQTSDAKFAAAMDRLQPMLMNCHCQGRTWREHSITAKDVLDFNSRIAESSQTLWKYARGLVDESVRKGFLREKA